MHHVWSYFERESFLENEVYVATVIAVARDLQFICILPQFSRLGLVFAGLQRSTWYVRTEQIEFNGSLNGTLCLM